MADQPPPPRRTGFIRRTWRGLRTPSARWSVGALVLIGLIIGAAGIIGTQVMVAATGTNQFCSNACHSMQWVANEYRQSVHYVNHSAVRAECHDCHIPHQYPELLWYKTKAGIKEGIGEARGVIDTEEKFNKERARMANLVIEEFKANNSANCRVCHVFSAEVIAKQKDFVQPMHQAVLAGNGTCVDCHKGVAHKAPE